MSVIKAKVHFHKFTYRAPGLRDHERPLEYNWASTLELIHRLPFDGEGALGRYYNPDTDDNAISILLPGELPRTSANQPNTDSIPLALAKTRRYNLSLKDQALVDSQHPVDDLGLRTDEGIVDVTPVVIFPKYNIVGSAYNHYAPRVTALAPYINIKIDAQTSNGKELAVECEQVKHPNVRGVLDSLDGVYEVEFSFDIDQARFGEQHDRGGIGNSIRGFFESTKSSKSKFTVRADNRNNPEVIEFIEEMLGAPDLGKHYTTIKVKRRKGEPMLDLTNEQLHFQTTIEPYMDRNTRVMDFENAWLQIASEFESNKEVILDGAGITGELARDGMPDPSWRST